MKELTIEEKAKFYEEALERARIYYSTTDSVADAELIELIFPELKESEDEKIRNGLIGYFRAGKCENISSYHGISTNDILAWLEKQGEKPQGKSALEALKEEKVDNQNCVKPVDKDKPKFNEGDWIVHHGTENIYQVVAVIGNQYQLKYGDNYTVQKCADVDRCARLWDITKDAKDGDVLCYKDEISLYKHDIINYNYTKQEKIFGGFVYYCCYDGKGFIVDNLYSLTEQDKMDIRPATKEQRDTLERAITNAGYIWYAGKKKLKKIIVPIFNIGDTIIKKHNYNIRDFGSFTITDITGGKYWYNDRIICDITEQDDWELLTNLK